MPLSKIPAVGVDATGTPSSTTFFRGDNTWAAPASSITSGTAVSASGTSIDFTGIPSGVKRITVMLSGVSTNGNSPLQIQIGSGSVTTSGYTSYAAVSYGTSVLTGTISSGFPINLPTNQGANTFMYGNATLNLLNSSTNTWAFSACLGINAGGNTVLTAGGSGSLSGILDRVRITTINGTDTFDAGTINILYE
jgi:hypothetical protein